MKNNVDKKTVAIVSAVFAVILAAMLLLIPAQRKNEFYEKWGRLAELAETNEHAKFITENEELYPTEILDFFYSDPDDLEFVWGYPFHKDDYGSMTFTDEELHSEKVPALYMSDNRWCYQSIDGMYIYDYGCVTVSLTMAYLWLTGNDDIDPYKILLIADSMNGIGMFGGITDETVSDICAEIGLNVETHRFSTDMQKDSHADIETVKSLLDNGHVIMAGTAGETFGVHALIICDYSGDMFSINDPADPENTSRLWSFEELESEMVFLYDISKK